MKLPELILKKKNNLLLKGYGNPIDAQEDGAHLFYIHETGRVLLIKKKWLFRQ